MSQSIRPYRISKACILIPHALLLNISNIVAYEIQEKLFNMYIGDIFEIKGLGTLRVKQLDILHDSETEKRWQLYGGTFKFRKFLYTCEFI